MSEYKDALANNPEIFSQAEIADTGETRLHLLAREGKVEIFESLLKDDRIHKELVRGLLFPDKLNWHPVMSATKADSGAKELIEILIGFLDTHITTEEEVQALIGKCCKRYFALFFIENYNPSITYNNDIPLKVWHTFIRLTNLL